MTFKHDQWLKISNAHRADDQQQALPRKHKRGRGEYPDLGTNDLNRSNVLSVFHL